MAGNKRIFIAQKSHVIQIEKKKKPSFPKEFLNKIKLKVEEHKYTYIFEIKFEKNLLFKNGGQNKFARLC